MKKFVIYAAVFFTVLAVYCSACNVSVSNKKWGTEEFSYEQLAQDILRDPKAKVIHSPTRWFSGQSSTTGYSMAPDYSQDSCEQQKYTWIWLNDSTSFFVYFKSGCKDSVEELKVQTRRNLLAGTEKKQFPRYGYSDEIIFTTDGVVTSVHIDETRLDESGNISIDGVRVDGDFCEIYKKGTYLYHRMDSVKHIPNLSKISGLIPSDTVGDYIGIVPTTSQYSKGNYPKKYYDMKLMEPQRTKGFIAYADSVVRAVVPAIKAKYER